VWFLVRIQANAAFVARFNHSRALLPMISKSLRFNIVIDGGRTAHTRLWAAYN